ncbi:MAG: hypothetical protein I4N51_12990 [Acinetobacter sp.]|nr:hypothetical protein [Acinetobacter sp.]
MAEKEIKRINIRMGVGLHDWFQDKATELGVSTSALMIVAMNEYRRSQMSVESMPLLGEMFKFSQSSDFEKMEEDVRNNPYVRQFLDTGKWELMQQHTESENAGEKR